MFAFILTNGTANPPLIDNLSTIVGLLVALSIASERLVEIIKGLIPFLNTANNDPKKEGWRRSVLQTLAVISGVVTAILAGPAIEKVVPEFWNNSAGVFALGLLASGGSGFWNAVLSYLLAVKDAAKPKPPSSDQPPNT